MSLLYWLAIPAVIFLLSALYVRLNDSRLKSIPARALPFSPSRCTPEDAQKNAARLTFQPPISVRDQLGEKTGRRYIIVGGGGFLGAWITTHLLERGEDYKKIRLLDLQTPDNYVIVSALSKGTQYIKVDMTDANALEAAFNAPWPETINKGEKEPEITVIHTAAVIRFYERHPIYVDRSARVNVVGTENVVKAAQSVGANVLIYTSSGSVSMRRSRFWLWPWESESPRFLQVVNDDDTVMPKQHNEFFSNYAVTKYQSEMVVRKADKTRSGRGVLRTGCIRPGNGIFGPRGDMLFGAYLMRDSNPSWVHNVIQSANYVENCSIAHLCYERRLIELLDGSKNPDIGGQAFCTTDPGLPLTYGDAYTVLDTLSNDGCYFPEFSPTLMLFAAQLIEAYYVSRDILISAGWKLARYLPSVQGDILFLQPSLFSLTSVHLIFDDSRARLSPEKGGLGYKGAFTTIEGLVKTVEEHNNGLGLSERRSKNAGIGSGLKRKAQRGIAKLNEKKPDHEVTGLSPVELRD